MYNDSVDILIKATKNMYNNIVDMLKQSMSDSVKWSLTKVRLHFFNITMI